MYSLNYYTLNNLLISMLKTVLKNQKGSNTMNSEINVF